MADGIALPAIRRAGLFMRGLTTRFRGHSGSAVMARGAVVVFAVNIAGTVLTVAAQVYLARLLGVDEFGVYAYVLSWLGALQVVGLMGVDTASLRYVAVYRGTGELARFWGFLRYARVHMALCTLASTLLLAIVVWMLRSTLGAHKAAAFWLGCLILPINVAVAFNGSLLQALKRVARSQLQQYVIRTSMMLGLLATLHLLLRYRMDAPTALVVNGMSGFATLVGLYWLTNHVLPMRADANAEAETRREWRTVSFAMFAISGAQLLLAQVDILIIGIFMDTTQAGLYAVASRIAMFVIFGINVVNSVLAPTISELFARHERAELQKTVTMAARIVLIYTVPVVLLFILGGRWLLGWFGAGFAPAYPALVVLVTGQVVVAVCGSVGFLLTMTGHQNDALRVIVVCGVLAVLLNLALTPTFGLIGAAFATMMATAARSLILSVLVRRRLDIRATAFGI